MALNLEVSCESVHDWITSDSRQASVSAFGMYLCLCIGKGETGNMAGKIKGSPTQNVVLCWEIHTFLGKVES